jgi:opacity protein-like surface antigen
MHTRLLIALLTGCFVAGTSVAAELPLAGPPQLSYPGRLLPVEWSGLYFGANAGYGWAKGSSTTGFVGNLQNPNFAVPGTFLSSTTSGTIVNGLGPTELINTDVFGSSKPTGAIAGGQMGFNWQWGRVVLGAEADGQWSGQQATTPVFCTPQCTATSTVKIKALATGRGRVGLAFDWLLPYVTAGAALVNVDDNLTLTVGGVTGAFKALSSTSLGWTAGAGVDVALSSNWSARFEYLHIEANGFKPTIQIPGVLGAGTASESANYRDDILRFALNYRFGPRGGPGVLEAPISANTFAINYDFLPSVAYVAGNATPAKPQQASAAPIPAKPQQATAAPIRTADAAPETTSIAIQPNPAPLAQPNPANAAQPNSTKSAFKNFNEIGALDEGDTIVLPKVSSKKPREREEEESQRLKRIMAICSGC